MCKGLYSLDGQRQKHVRKQQSHGYMAFAASKREKWTCSRMWTVKTLQGKVCCFGLQPLITGVNRGGQRGAGLEEGKEESIQLEVGECWGPATCWDRHTESPSLVVHTGQCPVRYGKREAWKGGLPSIPPSTSSLH